jgi:hypothetical protein
LLVYLVGGVYKGPPQELTVKNKLNLSVIIAMLVLLMGSPSAFAKGPKGDKGGKHAAKAAKHEGKGTSGVVNPGAAIRRDEVRAETATARDARRHRDREYVVDRDGHRRIVTDYYSREGLPPGLAKRNSLPPGLAKQLRERGRLPPGLQKRLTPVPYPLARRFPPTAPYYSRYFAGRDLVVIDRRTNRIVEVIPDVLPR